MPHPQPHQGREVPTSSPANGEGRAFAPEAGNSRGVASIHDHPHRTVKGGVGAKPTGDGKLEAAYRIRMRFGSLWQEEFGKKAFENMVGEFKRFFESRHERNVVDLVSKELL